MAPTSISFCPNYCSYRGLCHTNGDGQTKCDCYDGYVGGSCENSVLETLEKLNEMGNGDGLGLWWIIILLGLFAVIVIGSYYGYNYWKKRFLGVGMSGDEKLIVGK